MAIITFLSDFGLQDHFVAAVKGVMLSLNPDVTFVDISHQIPPQDIFTGAFTLSQAYSYFPSGTIHLAVVDPGVGTARKVLAATAGGHYFVAPDNGILSYIIDAHEDFTAYEVTADHYFRKPLSATFHARDIFAPVAAWISRRIELHQLGPVLKSPVRLQIPALKRVRDALIQGTILAVDHFGNLITNLKPDDVPASFRILAGQKEITGFRRTYSEGNPGELIVITGSTGYLEIAVRAGSAAATLNLKAGSPIGVIPINS
ncbi:MAG: SAM-dependent chlorinase/fluorinase [Acidobacteria bacterium]|nr:SAM-dependent chlorinase/fluorinase [Acidobacteriota bacterium]